MRHVRNRLEGTRREGGARFSGSAEGCTGRGAVRRDAAREKLCEKLRKKVQGKAWRVLCRIPSHSQEVSHFKLHIRKKRSAERNRSVTWRPKSVCGAQ